MFYSKSQNEVIFSFVEKPSEQKKWRLFGLQ